MQLAILGGGNMGRALLGGLLRQGTRPEHLYVGETDAASRESIARDFGITATAENLEAASHADLIVLAVKPQQIQPMVKSLQPVLSQRRPLLISVAAGVRTAALQSWAGPQVGVVRAMPNRPALVGAGVTGLFAAQQVSSTQRRLATQVMQAVGEVVWLDAEDDLDIVTALSGSGPAYFFLLAELLARGAASLGLQSAAAQRLAIATLYGSGQLAQASDGDLARLRAEVTSKGGTTAAALAVLNSPELQQLVNGALAAASRRSRELADEHGTQDDTRSHGSA
jgi:pyrroline-5-carboxylate reductase